MTMMTRRQSQTEHTQTTACSVGEAIIATKRSPRRCDCVVYAMARLSVCLCLSQVGVILKRINIGSHK